MEVRVCGKEGMCVCVCVCALLACWGSKWCVSVCLCVFVHMYMSCQNGHRLYLVPPTVTCGEFPLQSLRSRKTDSLHSHTILPVTDRHSESASSKCVWRVSGQETGPVGQNLVSGHFPDTLMGNALIRYCQSQTVDGSTDEPTDRLARVIRIKGRRMRQEEKRSLNKGTGERE